MGRHLNPIVAAFIAGGPAAILVASSPPPPPPTVDRNSSPYDLSVAARAAIAPNVPAIGSNVAIPGGLLRGHKVTVLLTLDSCQSCSMENASVKLPSRTAEVQIFLVQTRANEEAVKGLTREGIGVIDDRAADLLPAGMYAWLPNAIVLDKRGRLVEMAHGARAINDLLSRVAK